MLAEPEPEVDPSLEEVIDNTPVSERIIQRVHTAIDVWERRPTFSNTALVRIPNVEEIQQQIDELPVASEGDLQPAREVLEAATNSRPQRKPSSNTASIGRLTRSIQTWKAFRVQSCEHWRNVFVSPKALFLDSGIWKRSTLNKELAALQKARTQAITMAAIAGVGGLGATFISFLDSWRFWAESPLRSLG